TRLYPDHVSALDGVRGPAEPTVVAAEQPTPPSAYGTGSTSRLALLLTDRKSQWLGLVHGLKAIGLPLLVADAWQQAIRHRGGLVSPTLSGNVLSTEALKALAALPATGGTLIAVQVLGGGLQETFGFGDAVPSRDRLHLLFAPALCAELGFKDPREQQILLGSERTDTDRLGSYAYSHPADAPLATYDDGSAAITHRAAGPRPAYALGVDIGAILAKGYNNRDQWLERSYVNDFEPTIDVLLRLLRDLYRRSQADAVVLGTVPGGKSLSVLITHDIDYTRSVELS